MWFYLKIPGNLIGFYDSSNSGYIFKIQKLLVKQLIYFLFFSESEEETEETKKKKKLEDAMKRLEAEEREAERMLRWVTWVHEDEIHRHMSGKKLLVTKYLLSL